ncbi:efflux RND transporter permease subunit [Calditerrivibrio nitroreducens]|uniref:Acriflavin resistance protein n=1 Tax=Calditerrivibrio nitroreducens (strain DSM 19672 / NBRC 101217 / Yu37-1) TaxID=768670 RepID=E4TJP0_CALNY|nr:efflux RND transporter permease subunit [Calditerrivibrio nitroreducens]ADR19236.1 acriflavin resistance protein [Calditerrivibrio nitroreducens DSM 19672]
MNNKNHLSSFFINRPVTTILISLSIIIFGLFAYFKLPVNDLPSVDFPTIEVSATLPGASPETMASSVALPLEKEFSTIDGITSMVSTNTKGSTRITIQFKLEKDIDVAAQDVQTMIAKALRNLPSDMPSPPSFRKVNPADLPIFYIAVSSKTLPLYKVHEYADTFIAQQISTLSGVAQVNIYGSQKYAVRIDLKPEKVFSLGLSFDEIASTIKKYNPKLPTGSLYTPFKNFIIDSSGKPSDATGFSEIIVRNRDNKILKLKDIADVYDSVENNKVASWYKDTRAIVLAIQRQPGSNTLEIVDSIKKKLPVLKNQIPGSINIDILYDRTISIRESVNDVKFTLILTIGLVVLVIFIFLRNLIATIIPAVTLPIAIIGTFMSMYLLGFSVNNLSLMALILSVGFVVDDAIVMLENIFRHIEMGKKPYQAAIDGAREIYFTIISMTLSLVAVFIPVLFMKGILGRLLNEFAITISVAILISGFVSLSLTPMMASRIIKVSESKTHGRIYNFFEKVFNFLLKLYKISLLKVLNYKKTVILFFFLTTFLTIYLFYHMPMGFLPNDDIGQLFVVTEAAPGSTFEEMAGYHKKISRILLEDKNISGFMSSIGVGGASSSENSGRFFITLKPKKERKMNAEKIAASLRSKTANIPGIKVFVQNPPPIRIGGSLTKSQYQFVLTGSDIDELFNNAKRFEQDLSKLNILQDVTSDLELKNPQLSININKEKCSLYGVSPEKIEQVLQYSFSDYQVSTIYGSTNQYKVILNVGSQFQSDTEKLSKLFVLSPNNSMVQLSNLVQIKETLGPLTVNHMGQLPAVTISFNLKEGVALSEAVKEIEKLATKNLPSSISTSFQGTAQAFQSSTQGLWILILLAIVVIYIILGVLYESFIHPLTILSGLPSAGLGAILVLKLMGYDLNIYGFVGLIMLLGIVKKNAIMMIDFALEAERKKNIPPLDAIVEGAFIRFRPIMMTTFAALVGAIPIAIGIGAGAEARKSLGIAIVGGLIISQVITLYITPVIYYYLDKISKKIVK